MSVLKKYSTGFFTIGKQTASAWMEADPFRQSAVVAYYAIFSIPALLVIVITFVSFVFGHDKVQHELSAQIGKTMGTDAAGQVEYIISNASERNNSIIACIRSIITLILGSMGVF